MPQPTPLVITVPFGASATNINVIPATTGTTTGLASWAFGFQLINETPIAAGGIAPKGEDINGLGNALSQSIAFWQAGQSMPYNAAIATAISGYAIGATVVRADGTGYWTNTVANNSTNPDAGGAGWVPSFNYGLQQFALTNANVVLSAPQAAKTIINLQGTLTGNVLLTFPAQVQEWLIVNATTGNFTVSAATPGGNAIIIPGAGGPAYSVPIWCDGAQLYLQNVAPLSGSFTITYVGGTSAPTGVVNWSQVGNSVTMTLPGSVSAVSNSTSFNYVGIPAALLPTSWATILQEFPLAAAQNNGAYVAGAACLLTEISSVPAIQFFLLGSTTGWAASGVKSALGTFTYNVGL
jgi:hypothetical protein